MNMNDLLSAVRDRIVEPKLRVDLSSSRTPPLYPMATTAALDAAEDAIGSALPELLRRLFSEVENGGFGPGAGLVGVEGGHTDVDGRTLGASYAALRSRGWPEGVLPLCDLGDAAWSCLDGRSSDHRILTMNQGEVTQTTFTLSSWLAAWVSGVNIENETFDLEDAVIVNPFTKKPTTVKRRARAKGTPTSTY